MLPEKIKTAMQSERLQSSRATSKLLSHLPPADIVPPCVVCRKHERGVTGPYAHFGTPCVAQIHERLK